MSVSATELERAPVRSKVLFEDVYRAHLGYVWHTVRRLGIPARHLEDVAHDVFVVVHRQLDAYDPTRPMRPWLFGIAFRVTSDHLRRASNRRELLEGKEGTPDVEDPSPRADARLEAHDREALFERALLHLDLKLRATFVMHAVDGHTAPEIASTLDIPVNTVYSRIRIARERFEAAVRREQSR